jgi:hypothetical protein
MGRVMGLELMVEEEVEGDVWVEWRSGFVVGMVLRNGWWMMLTMLKRKTWKMISGKRNVGLRIEM